MICAGLALAVGALLVLEGGMLLTMSEERRKEIIAALSRLSLGQIHFIGFAMCIGGLITLAVCWLAG